MNIADAAKLLLKSRSKYVAHIEPKLSAQEEAICEATEQRLQRVERQVSELTKKARRDDAA